MAAAVPPTTTTPQTMTNNEDVSVAPTQTEDEMVTVEVTLKQVVENVVEATFKVTVPRSDAENHDVLLQACDEQVQNEQDAFGYGERQAGEWHFEYEQELQDLAIDVLHSKVVFSKITGTVEEDED
jgi:hypothetical protein